MQYVASSKKSEVSVDRRSTKDRRSAQDRRQKNAPVSEERRGGQRRKGQRRRQIDPTTCERDYSNDEIEFMQALDAYKRANGRMFPTCSEILEVVREMGYVRLRPEKEPVAECEESEQDSASTATASTATGKE